MKKLKIQKALITTCLALASTITTNNATNGGGGSYYPRTRSECPDVKDPDEENPTTKTKEDTFSYHFQQYKLKHNLDVPLKPPTTKSF